MKDPKNETFLAAELMAAAIGKHRPWPGQAARTAQILCSLGRSYFRLSERLCGGEEEWGPYPEAADRMNRAEKRRETLLRRAIALCEESPFRVEIEQGDLCFIAVSKRGPRLSERTVCL